MLETYLFVGRSLVLETYLFAFRYSTAKQITDALDGIHQRRGNTLTYVAIDQMHNEMFSARYARPGVPRIGIVITDGVSNDTAKTATAARAARADGITLFAVGVGKTVNK